MALAPPLRLPTTFSSLSSPQPSWLPLLSSLFAVVANNNRSLQSRIWQSQPNQHPRLTSRSHALRAHPVCPE